MSGSLTPFRIQKCLRGLRYPAQKEQVLERARQQGADERVMHALALLPERAYESPIALSREVSRQSALSAA